MLRPNFPNIVRDVDYTSRVCSGLKAAGPAWSVGCAVLQVFRTSRFDPRSGHISFVQICHEIISMAILSLPQIQVGAVGYWRKYGQLVLVNRLGSLHRNSVGKLTDDTPYVPQIHIIIRTESVFMGSTLITIVCSNTRSDTMVLWTFTLKGIL